MIKWFFLSLFLSTALGASEQKGVCRKIKRGFDSLWQEVDKSVGVEFFLVVLKGNDRMPSSELDQVEYYKELLRGMKRTSVELSDRGLKFNSKKMESLEKLIRDLDHKVDCQI